MKFEVVNKDGQVVMWTEDAECVPTPDELDSMTSAGYRYKVDGKVVAKSNVMKAVGGDKPAASSISKEVKLSGTDTHPKLTKGVRCIETGQVYRNRVEAGRAYGISDSSVGDSIRLKKKVKGYSFEVV